MNIVKPEQIDALPSKDLALGFVFVVKLQESVFLGG